MKKNKKNIFLYFIEMLIVFILIDCLITILPGFISNNISYYKYGTELLLEVIYALLVLVVMLLFKNSYVFTDKKQKFFKSITLGFPMLIIAGISLLGSLSSLDGFNLGNFINLLFLTIFIGIAEEFLCRGWLQNEFIERYGDTKKHIILSISFSSLIFGLIHLTNLVAGQDLLTTITQIIQATSAGLLLGSIYYKTKNIWAVIFLHGVYDFCLMLGDMNLIKDCTFNTPTTGIIIYNSVSTLLLSGINFVGALLVLKRTNLKDGNKVIDKNDKRLVCTMIALFVLLLLPIQVFIEGYEDYQVCYEFNSKTIKYNDIETHYPYYDSYTINHIRDVYVGEDDKIEANYIYEFFINNDGLLEVKNKNNDDFVVFDYKDIKSFEIVENMSSYLVIINSTNTETKIYYSNYLNKNNLSNTQAFLEEFKKSFKTYDVPLISEMGYMTLKNENYKYPLFISETRDKYIIDIDSNLYKVEYEK